MPVVVGISHVAVRMALEAHVEAQAGSCWPSGGVGLKLEMVVGKMRGPTETLQFEVTQRARSSKFGWTLPRLGERPGRQWDLRWNPSIGVG